MRADLLTAFLILGGFLLALSFISSGLVRRFSANKLSLKEGFFISVLAYAVATVPLVVYFITKRHLGIPPTVDAAATIAWMFVAGSIISRRAAAYGVVKTGWFGVGAKTMFSILALSWVVVAVIFVFNAIS
jgi:hypothetical protein